MDHYFRVNRIPEQQTRGKRKGFLASWLASLSVTGWLILANVAVFIALAIIESIMGADSYQNQVLNYLALQPNSFFNNGYLWTVFTSMFMHANFFHLFVNMLSLFFIGKFLEMLIGKKRFFWIYMASGIFGGIFFATLSYFFGGGFVGSRLFGDASIYAVGASGAIFGIAGVLAFLTPKNRVYLIAGPLIAIIAEAIAYSFMPNSQILGFIDGIVTIYIFIALFAMFSFNSGMRKLSVPIEMPFWFLPIAAIVPLVIIGFFVELPIGNMAHLGGFIAGACYGLYLRVKYKNKVRAISAMFSR